MRWSVRCPRMLAGMGTLLSVHPVTPRVAIVVIQEPTLNCVMVCPIPCFTFHALSLLQWDGDTRTIELPGKMVASVHKLHHWG